MAFIKKIIDDFDGTDEAMQNAREALQGLSALAQAKADLLLEDIEKSIRTAGSDENRTIPIAAIIGKKVETRAFVSTDAQHLTKIVEESLSGFISGTQEGVLGGISKLIGGALTALLGESTGSENSAKYYYIATEGVYAIRLDIAAWSRSINATQIKQKAEKVTCVVAVKSAVDLSKIDFSTFVVLYAVQLQKSEMSEKDLKAAILYAREVYDIFHGATSRPSRSDLGLDQLERRAANLNWIALGSTLS